MKRFEETRHYHRSRISVNIPFFVTCGNRDNF
jgi:hypothetical protein